METPKDEVLYTEADIIDSSKEEDLGDKPFNGFKYPNHALEEDTVTVKMPRGLGKTEDILPPPAEKESDYNHFSSNEEESAEMINLQDILVELSKDYTLDNLNLVSFLFLLLSFLIFLLF